MLLSVNDLEIFYDRLRAVDGVSFDVDEGEVVGLVGPNGAGKTTTLLASAGALKPRRGKIIFDGIPVVPNRPEDAVRRGIALVPEGRRVFGSLTVEENLRAGAISRRRGADLERDLDQFYGRFPVLASYRDAKAGQLSGGEQQLLAIARALMSRPRLLLVDEASLGLSPQAIQLVFEILLELREEGRSIVVVEHDAERVISIADRIYAVVEGKSHLVGSGAEARISDFEAIYLGQRAAAERIT
jgi:branched-chain amino acid transport system ATP-binding protein